MLGGDCEGRFYVTHDLFLKARRRVHKFAFVGLADAPNASVCLLYHMYGGEPLPFMFHPHVEQEPLPSARARLDASYW